jgi:hypothetical protein
VITVMTDTEAERMDVLDALRDHLGGATPFQVMVRDKITDWYPSGWASGKVRTPCQ